MKEGVVAQINIKNIPGMTSEGRKEIVQWMRKHAREIERHHGEYTKGVFRAMFITPYGIWQ